MVGLRGEAPLVPPYILTSVKCPGLFATTTRCSIPLELIEFVDGLICVAADGL